MQHNTKTHSPTTELGESSRIYYNQGLWWTSCHYTIFSENIWRKTGSVWFISECRTFLQVYFNKLTTCNITGLD